ncbi:MAG: flagellar export chaperone FlgN [candidate division KSB1 bacterium]|nr:flagellar export chaperone FlgN [candidate division KSB1 bacterium]
MAALASGVVSTGSLEERLQWIRLAGLLRRQVGLMRNLLALLLRIREAIVLVDLPAFQKTALDQIQLLHELEAVGQESREQISALVPQARDAAGEAGLAEAIAVAPPEDRRELVELQQTLIQLAEDVRRLAHRNEKLMTALGEIREAQYQALWNAFGRLLGTYGERKTFVPASVCDVVG